MPTSDETIPSDGPGQEYVNRGEQSEFMEFFNTINLSEATDVMGDLKHFRNKKLKTNIDKGPTRLEAP